MNTVNSNSQNPSTNIEVHSASQAEPRAELKNHLTPFMWLSIKGLLKQGFPILT